MQAEEPLGGAQVAGEVAHAQAAGVGRDNGIFAQNGRQLGEQAGLEVEILEHRLDQQVDLREVAKRLGDTEPGQRCFGIGGADAGLSPPLARKRCPLRPPPPRRLPGRESVSRTANLLPKIDGDPAAHGAGTDDTDRRNGHAASLRTMLIRSLSRTPA